MIIYIIKDPLRQGASVAIAEGINYMIVTIAKSILVFKMTPTFIIGPKSSQQVF